MLSTILDVCHFHLQGEDRGLDSSEAQPEGRPTHHQEKLASEDNTHRPMTKRGTPYLWQVYALWHCQAQ